MSEIYGNDMPDDHHSCDANANPMHSPGHGATSIVVRPQTPVANQAI